METLIYKYEYVDYDNSVSLNNIYISNNKLLLIYNEGLNNDLRLILFALIGDFQFYCYHILCHKIPFLWKIHSIHHKSFNPNIFSGLSFHPIEAILYWMPLLIVILIKNTPSYIFSIFKFGWMIGAIPGHIGYGDKTYKKDSYIISIFTSEIYFHYIHHSKLKYNYGGFMPIWDIVFGTNYPLTPYQHFKTNKL